MANQQKNTPVVEVDERTPLIAHEEEPESNASEQDNGASAAVIWTVFPILLAGVFLANAATSVVIAISQHIASEFNASSSAAWLLTIYTLAQSSSQPLYGKLSDIYGRRSCLVFCWVMYGIGCVIVAFGQTYWQILIGRAVGGVGSAGQIALTSIIVADLVPLRDVAKFRTYVNLTGTVARSMGGPLGSWLTAAIGWRWCFNVQLPVVVLGLTILFWILPEPSKDDTKNEEASKLGRIDFAGAFALVGAVLTGSLALDLASKGAPIFYTIALALAFVFSMASFVVVEKYYAKEPVMPLGLISRRDVLTPCSIVALQAAGQFGLLFSIPIYFQVIGHESVSNAGSRVVPVVIGNALGTIVSGRRIHKTRKYKALTTFGNAIAVVGFLLLILRWNGSTKWHDALLVSLPGVGMGIIQSTTFIHLVACVEKSEVSIAGTTWFLAQSIGILIGASFSTALINSVLQFRMEALLDGIDNKQDIIRRVLSNVKYIEKLPLEIAKPVSTAYIQALMSSNALSMGFVGCGLMVTLFMMKEKTL